MIKLVTTTLLPTKGINWRKARISTEMVTKPSNNMINNNLGQIPQVNRNNQFVNPEIRRITEFLDEAIGRIASKKAPSLLEPQTIKPPPDPQIIEAGKWLKIR